MLKTILAISGKPGLYKLISQAKNMLIVETVSADKKRVPVYASDKVNRDCISSFHKVEIC